MEDYTANEEFVLIVDTSLLRIAKLRFTYIDPAYRGDGNQPKAHRCSPRSSRPNSPVLTPRTLSFWLLCRVSRAVASPVDSQLALALYRFPAFSE